jgi:transcriptional regulator with XRE-family HTH domain
MPRSRPSPTEEILRNLLIAVRSEAGLRQIDLAKRLGKPQSFVSKYESGERRLDLIELHKLCQALGISLVVLARKFEAALK